MKVTNTSDCRAAGDAEALRPRQPGFRPSGTPMKYAINTLLWTAGFDQSHFDLLPDSASGGLTEPRSRASSSAVSLLPPRGARSKRRASKRSSYPRLRVNPASSRKTPPCATVLWRSFARASPQRLKSGHRRLSVPSALRWDTCPAAAEPPTSGSARWKVCNRSVPCWMSTTLTSRWNR